MTASHILVAGIGNIFHGDDAFGVEVAQRLLARPPVPGVHVVDFGIRGLDLAYALLDDYDLSILIDATPRGADPGTLSVIELDLSGSATLPPDPVAIDTHGMNPMRVLRMVQSLGGRLGRILLVGCEPAYLGPEEGFLGLSDTVAAVIDPAVELVDRIVAKNLQQTFVATATGD